MINSDQTHYTAWLGTSPEACCGNHCEILVSVDQILTFIEENGCETPIWEPTTQAVLEKTLSVPNDNRGHEEALSEAESALAEAGWHTVGGWIAYDAGYHVTVAREE